jgi:hypothetical protein
MLSPDVLTLALRHERGETPNCDIRTPDRDQAHPHCLLVGHLPRPKKEARTTAVVPSACFSSSPTSPSHCERSQARTATLIRVVIRRDATDLVVEMAPGSEIQRSPGVRVARACVTLEAADNKCLEVQIGLGVWPITLRRRF